MDATIPVHLPPASGCSLVPKQSSTIFIALIAANKALWCVCLFQVVRRHRHHASAVENRSPQYLLRRLQNAVGDQAGKRRPLVALLNTLVFRTPAHRQGRHQDHQLRGPAQPFNQRAKAPEKSDDCCKGQEDASRCAGARLHHR